mmetsp:Transcript_14601/g.18045  ORF Transcript_14601/g.18045 Transcript_14601/m.18045 type:complete len:97 (-) Transcript_14601:1930-2220(-)
MPQKFLKAPITDKFSVTGEFGDKIKYAVSEMQSWRVTMEDAWIAEENIGNDIVPNSIFSVSLMDTVETKFQSLLPKILRRNSSSWTPSRNKSSKLL